MESVSPQADLQSAKDKPHHRFELLDGLRGLAAVIVVADHVPSATMQGLIHERGLAVDFFYVLSGFVLAHAFGARLAGKTIPRLSPLGFMARRYVRFWPMLFAAFAFEIAIEWYRMRWLIHDSWLLSWFGQIGFGLLFLPAPYIISPEHPFPILGQAHTMFFELFANLVLALLAPFLTQKRLFALLPLAGAALAAYAIGADNLAGVGWTWPTFTGGFLRVLYPFFAGVAVYRIWLAKPGPATPAWAAAVLLLILLISPLGASNTLYELTASLVLFPALVYICASSRVSGATRAMCVTAGALSYGLYLIQFPVIHWLEFGLARFGVMAAQLDVWFYILVVVISGVATALLRTFFDQPLQQWLGTRLRLR